VTAYAIGDHSVVLETTEGREIRVTAWHDRAAGKYVSEYERRGVIRSGGHELRVWAQTPAYKRCTADDAASCLEAAVLEVDRVHSTDALQPALLKAALTRDALIR
jgi:hypothetical protein